MSQDLKITPNIAGLYDLEVDTEARKYKAVDGFETAIYTSLFTDARAPSFRINEASKRRGSVSDILLGTFRKTFGSILWTFEQSRITQEILNQIRDAAEEAFIWLVDTGAILGVTASVEKTDNRSISINLEFRNRDNTIKRYQVLWRATDVS